MEVRKEITLLLNDDEVNLLGDALEIARLKLREHMIGDGRYSMVSGFSPQDAFKIADFIRRLQEEL